MGTFWSALWLNNGDFPWNNNETGNEHDPGNTDIPEILQELRDQLFEIAAHAKIAENIESDSFKGEAEINGIWQVLIRNRKAKNFQSTCRHLT